MYKINNEFIIRTDEEEAIAFHTVTGTVFLLNEVAFFIMNCIVNAVVEDGENFYGSIFQRLKEEYDLNDATEESVYTDIEVTIKDLVQKNIIIKDGE